MDEAAQEALNRLERDPLAEEVVQQQEQQHEQQHEQEQARAAASEGCRAVAAPEERKTTEASSARQCRLRRK